MRFLKRYQAGRSKLWAVIAVTALAMMAFTGSASAASHHPTGEFSQFGECPLNTKTVETCIYAVTKTGSFVIGNKTVPIKTPVTLQGGIIGASTESKFVGAENGQTLSKSPQPVPGGLLGITAPTWWPGFIQTWFNNLINEGFTGVNATLEVAGPASNIGINTENVVGEEGVGLSIPAKVHLENAILGSSCYIGTDASPVNVPLTTGTTAPPPPNKPIKGTAGTPKFNSEFTLLTLTGASLVNNSFAAPETTGCGGIFSIFVNPLVNSILGTPAAAGKNSAILNGDLKAANAGAVKASE
jgi:hypothetical protein